MVETKIQGDGVVRNIIYAKWRTDLPVKKGYTPELINVDVPVQYYDNLEGQPDYIPGRKTFLDFFELHLKERRDDKFLGTRVKIGEKEFGDYEWMTYRTVEEICHNLSRGMNRLELVTKTEGDG